MNEVVPIAKQSPSITDGVISWYMGDAFVINWEVHLTEEEFPVEFQEGDRLEWSFFSILDKCNCIHKFIFNYEDIDDYTVTLFFSKDISAKFKVGCYTYCVKFFSHDGRIVTINAHNKIKVEPCH